MCRTWFTFLRLAFFLLHFLSSFVVRISWIKNFIKQKKNGTKNCGDVHATFITQVQMNGRDFKNATRWNDEDILCEFHEFSFYAHWKIISSRDLYSALSEWFYQVKTRLSRIKLHRRHFTDIVYGICISKKTNLLWIFVLHPKNVSAIGSVSRFFEWD